MIRKKKRRRTSRSELVPLKNPQIQRDPLPQPRCTLRVIPFIFPWRRIGMDEHAQRAPVDDQPGYESPKLRWGEYIYFEHGDRMRANGPVEETVDAKLWNYGSILYISEDAFVPSSTAVL
jgi:hypothetical protein